MSNLITRARALGNLNNRATTTDENDTLDALIAAVSRTIEQYCWRGFAIASYDELYPGYGQRDLMLRSYPIVSIERVAEAPIAVVRVTNTSGSSQRATVKVTAPSSLFDDPSQFRWGSSTWIWPTHLGTTSAKVVDRAPNGPASICP